VLAHVCCPVYPIQSVGRRIDPMYNFPEVQFIKAVAA
jgi:hypothetical protein